MNTSLWLSFSDRVFEGKVCVRLNIGYPLVIVIFGDEEDIVWGVGLYTLGVLDIGIGVPPIPGVLRVLVNLSFGDYMSMCDDILRVDSFVLSE